MFLVPGFRLLSKNHAKLQKKIEKSKKKEIFLHIGLFATASRARHIKKRARQNSGFLRLGFALSSVKVWRWSRFLNMYPREKREICSHEIKKRGKFHFFLHFFA